MMDKSTTFVDQISVELSTIEEIVLSHILSAAHDKNTLSPQYIATQVPYAPETVKAAIDHLLTLGLIQVAIGDDFVG